MTNNQEKKLWSLVNIANQLARMFYARMGYCVDKNYKMYQATHPQEVLCWTMACDAISVFKEIDMREVLSELGEGNE